MHIHTVESLKVRKMEDPFQIFSMYFYRRESLQIYGLEIVESIIGASRINAKLSLHSITVVPFCFLGYIKLG